MHKNESETIVAAALLGLVAGLTIGAALVWNGTKKDVNSLIKKLEKSDLYKKTYASWAAKSIAALTVEQFEPLREEMITDMNFLILTETIDK